MPTTRLRYTLTAGAATALILLTGCTGDSEAGPPPLPTVSPAPTVGAFASDAPEPETEPIPETAKQVIRRWAELSNEIQNTGETSEFRELSKRCPACLGLADRVDEIYQRGGYIKTEGWKVLSVKLPPDREGRVDALVSVRSGETEYKESRNGRLQRLTGASQKFRFVIRKKDETWAVLEYHLVAA